MNRTALACTTIATLGLLASAAMLTAGPLTPPAGAPASTYKTLSEVEPRTPISLATTPGDADSLYKITQPGSYYLTGNITGVSGKHGIEIAASNVTVDLNGFALIGAAGSLHGVVATTVSPTNITAQNGSVRGWTRGVDFSIAGNARLSRLLVSDNTATGIMMGHGAVVSECSSIANAQSGISTIQGTVIIDSSARFNDGVGITTGSACLVSRCTIVSNGQTGIETGIASTVAECTVYGNSTGGIQLSSRAAAIACTVSNNTSFGIATGSGGAVRDCTAANNNGHGILVANTDARIEGNTCTGNVTTGIRATSTGNLIIRNSCSGNGTNYNINAGNTTATIVTTEAALNAAANANVNISF